MLSITVAVALFGAAETVERFVVKTDSVPQLNVDPYSAQLTISGAAAPLAAALKASRLCPTIEKTPTGVTLRCTTRRLEASTEPVPGGHAIDLRALIGLPWRKGHGGPTLRPWAPESVGLGGPCPGTRAAGKAECFLAAGQGQDARLALQEAIGTDDAAYAWLRKGDLALEAGERLAALEAFQKAGDKGPWGRLARTRVCEVLGSCAPRAYDPVALPAPLAQELTLRAARADALMDHLDAAMRSLLARPGLCAGAEAECAGLLRAGLTDDTLTTRALALEAWAALQDTVRGVDVTLAAAEAAAALGAKKFAGDLLASATADVPPGALADHLFRAARHYADAGDSLRAQVIADFAKARLGDKALTSARWRDLLAAIHPRNPARPNALGVGTDRAIASDCQRADAVLTAARKAGAAPEP